MCHGHQMKDVHVIVSGADGRWLQVYSLLLVQSRHGQHQPDLKAYRAHTQPPKPESILIKDLCKVRGSYCRVLNIESNRGASLSQTYQVVEEIYIQNGRSVLPANDW